MRSPDDSTGVDAPAPVEDVESAGPAQAPPRDPAPADPASGAVGDDEASGARSPSVSEADEGPVDDEPRTPSLADVLAGLDRIESGLGEYDRLLTRQTEVTSRLHSENQDLKKGELRQAQSSLVIGVIRVIDDIARMAETAEEATRSDLSLIGESLADALAGHGVERVHVDVGGAFEGKIHKIAQVQPTADEGLNRTVAAVTRPGFAWADGTVIRVADVVVYKFVPGHGPIEPAGTDEVQAEPEADATAALRDPEDPQQ